MRFPEQSLGSGERGEGSDPALGLQTHMEEASGTVEPRDDRCVMFCALSVVNFSELRFSSSEKH